eukprot:TRINITY_DN11414_c0_g1_i18.p1 TRINITY_DN11414_c0_g1~~TRINITY_DN11414_c0_g1_i18.p1  ORF type:complete len:110 (+),score=15.89 TRINITY_DN11414_c0_g1_i18:111-440(+)
MCIRDRVGTAVRFTANVSYVEHNLIHVAVDCDKIIIGQEPQRATEFHCTFITGAKGRPVMPTSYECAMKYLEGKRRISALQISSFKVRISHVIYILRGKIDFYIQNLCT